MQEHEIISLIISEKKYSNILDLIQKIVNLVFMSNLFTLLYGKRRDPAIKHYLDRLALQMRRQGLPCNHKDRYELYDFVKKIDRALISGATHKQH